ncbi:hypothetical protein PMAYCL1PPCAC_01339, partial [Pristionchus mayeri]
QMSDDGGSPVESPQEFQPQSPQAEADFQPESPTPEAQAAYDENAPVSPSPEEEEEEVTQSTERSPAYGEDEESQEQLEHQPISPVEQDEAAADEHDADDAEEKGEEREECDNEDNMPVSPVADGDVEHNEDNMPVSPAADSAESQENMPISPVAEGEGEEHNEDSLESPSKRVKRAMIDSDDEEEREDKTQSDGDDKSQSGDEQEGERKTAKKRVLDSDDSDAEGEKKEEGDEQEVGDLMANIFGDESDEEGGGETKRPADDSDDDMGGVRRDDDDVNQEWDFDVMLRNKKAEKKKIRRRKKDGGIDIINDDDGTIENIVTAMKKAASDDRHSNMERQPATRKRKMLQNVKAVLLRSDLVETMIDGGMMSAISEWLAPLPDKSLPALEIRSELLKILQGFARLDQGVLKQSGLGKAVMMLFKHPRETKENKKLAHKLISDWARPIFQIDTDFRSMSREDRMERDLAQMPAAKKRRMSGDEGSSRGGFKDIQEDLRPGMKGYIGRARVPKVSSKDYVVRPAPLVEGTFKGEKKGKGNERLDKATRDFKERTKAMKAKRAIGVSIEGRRMEI